MSDATEVCSVTIALRLYGSALDGNSSQDGGGQEGSRPSQRADVEANVTLMK